jgi:hypothetical protein
MTDTTAPKSFIDRQRDAALQEARERGAVRRAITDIVIGKANTTATVGDVVSLDADSHVVEVANRRSANPETTWTTVHDGANDRMHFYTLDMALLHLIALRAGDDSRGTAAAYAGRVLGVKDDAAN